MDKYKVLKLDNIHGHESYQQSYQHYPQRVLINNPHYSKSK